jgi:hypothetical protein
MSVVSSIIDQARSVFLLRADGGTAKLRKFNGTTAAAGGIAVPAYSHYPTDEDLQQALGDGIQVGSEDVVLNLLTGDTPGLQTVSEDRVDVVMFNGGIQTFRVKKVLKRQFVSRIGDQPLVDRVLVCPIPTDG